MDPAPDEHGARVTEFEAAVARHLGFLTVDHGFTQEAPRAAQLDAPLDARVSISFERTDLRVTIALGLVASGLGILLRDNGWSTRPAPEDGGRRIKAVPLEYLIEFLTDGQVQPLLPHAGDGRTGPTAEAGADLDGVLGRLAQRLAAHADAVLDPGVTSAFPGTDAYYRRKLGL